VLRRLGITGMYAVVRRAAENPVGTASSRRHMARDLLRHGSANPESRRLRPNTRGGLRFGLSFGGALIYTAGGRVARIKGL
jgi:hypothetical protein